MTYRSLIVIILILFLSTSACKVYKQDILFRLDEDFSESNLSKSVDQVESNYRLRVNDRLFINAFTQDGELLIDPVGDRQTRNNQNQNNVMFDYLIQVDGSVKIPVVGKVSLVGLTVDEAERLLEDAFNEDYVGVFVKLQVNSRRVVVLGASGGAVIPFNEEKITLAEVLAIYGGIQGRAKARSIRVIRGDLKNPEVYVVDLTTVSGMMGSIVDIEPGDVIYMEPYRRAWMELIKDFGPLFSFTTSMSTIIFLILSL